MSTSPAPLVSIIMPSYNRAGLIGETIESIRQQTFDDWELLVIDDGSDDNTSEVVREFHDPRIRFFSESRMGIIGRLKNIGFSKARGPVIAFMDSDDLWEPSKLRQQLDALNTYPEAGFSLTGGYNFKKNGVPLQYYYKEREGIFYGELLIPCFNSSVAALTPTLVFYKDCLSRTGMFDESRLFSDIEFMLRLAENYKGIILYQPLLYRRLHEGNTTNANWELGYTEYISLITYYRQKGKLPPAIARQALYRLYINYGEKCLYYHQRTRAINKFMRAWNYNRSALIPFRKISKAIIS